MEIKRSNFGFTRVVNPESIIDQSILLGLSLEEIAFDENIIDEVLDDGDEIKVFKNVEEPYQNEIYCYILINMATGGDGVTKKIAVKKVIADSTLISQNLFNRIFEILLSSNDSEATNRIEVYDINTRYHGVIGEIAKIIAVRITELYEEFTSDENRTYTTPVIA